MHLGYPLSSIIVQKNTLNAAPGTYVYPLASLLSYNLGSGGKKANPVMHHYAGLPGITFSIICFLNPSIVV
jgi:hypothetical protein